MIRPIENWKKSWKFGSMWWMAAAFLMNVADFIVSNIPLGSLHSIPHGKSITIILLGLAMIARVVNYKGLNNGKDE